MISQDVMDEYGMPEPTHHFNFEEDGSIFTSLDWELSEDQARQMAVYYADLFSGGDNAAILEEEMYEFETEGYADDGTKLIFSFACYGDNRTAMIKRRIQGGVTRKRRGINPSCPAAAPGFSDMRWLPRSSIPLNVVIRSVFYPLPFYAFPAAEKAPRLYTICYSSSFRLSSSVFAFSEPFSHEL